MRIKTGYFILAVFSLFWIIVLIILIPKIFERQDYLIEDQPSLMRYSHPEEVAGIFRPAWADFPQTISFVATRDGSIFSLYQMDLNSKQLKDLFPDERIGSYSWNQDHTQLAFFSHNKTTGIDGLSIHQNITGNKRYFTTTGCIGEPESWSPDSTKILTIGSCGKPLRPCLCAIDLTSEKEEVLFEGGMDEWLIEASWSPDGKKVVFTCSIPLHGLCIQDLESKQIRKLVHLPGTSIDNPRWIMNGNWILFIIREGYSSKLSAIRNDGKCKTNLLPDISGVDRFDVAEESGNIHFLFLDENRNLYTLDLAEAIRPVSLDKLFQCSD